MHPLIRLLLNDLDAPDPAVRREALRDLRDWPYRAEVSSREIPPYDVPIVRAAVERALLDADPMVRRLAAQVLRRLGREGGKP